MNKILTKVTALCVGLAMVAGVGVAVGHKSVGEAKADYTAKSSLAAGDVIYMTYTTSSSGWELTSVTSGTKGNVTAFSGTSLNGTYPLTVEVSGDNYYFKDSSNKYIAYTGTATSSNNKLWLTDSASDNGAAWTVSFSGTNATIRNVYNTSRYLKGNNQSGSERICGYTTTGTLTLYSAGAEPTQKYSVIFNANAEGVTGMPSNLTDRYGTVSLADVAHPFRENYTFKGWSLTSDGEVVSSVTVSNADVNVYAIWKYVDPEVGTPVEIVKGTGKSYDDITVNGTAGCKIGTSSETGTVTVTVPASTNYLSIHIAGWKDKSVSIGVSVSSGTITPTEHAVASDSGVSGNSPFTLSGDEDDFLYTYELSGIEVETVVTFTATANFRAVFWTANYKISSDPSLENLTIKLNDSTTGPFELPYSSTSSAMFYANDDEGTDINADWSSSDETVFTVSKNGNNVCILHFVKPGVATLTAEAEGYKKATASVTVLKGDAQTVVVSGSMTKTAYYVGEQWSAEGLSATVSYSTGYVETDADVAWTFTPATPTAGVTSVTATATSGSASGNSTAQVVSVTRTNPLQVLYTLADNADVDVYGVYVGYQDGSGPIIMDGAYGMLCYFGKSNPHDVSGYTEGTTILHVTGKMASYNGLRQIGSPVISVASGTFDEPDTPIVYAAKGGETVEYSSRLTTVTGTAVCTKNDFSGEAGAKDITMAFTVSGQTIQVFYKMAAQTADTEAYAAMKAAVEDHTEITIKGFTSWYNGFQVQMNGVVEAAESYTAEEFAQYLLDETDAVCEGYVEGDNNYDALVVVWNKLQNPTDPDKKSYPFLPAAEKLVLGQADADEEGSTVEKAIARYEHICSAYGLSQFIEGRDPITVVGNYALPYQTALDSSSSITIIVIVAVTSMTLLGVTLVLRKRKHQ